MSFSKPLILLIACVTIGCSDEKPPYVPRPRMAADAKPKPVRMADFIDSIDAAAVDTSTLDGQRELAKNRHLIDNPNAGYEIDTMMDLNYDGHLDLVWYEYYSSGTGFKYHDIVYLYRPAQRTYEFDTLLSSGVNTAYFLDRKKITNVYIPHNGGSGYQLEWKDGKWVRTIDINVVDRKDDSVTWEITDLLTNTHRYRKAQFDYGGPPKDVLETKIPAER